MAAKRAPSRRAVVAGGLAVGALAAAGGPVRAQAKSPDAAALARMGAAEVVAGLAAKRFAAIDYAEMLIERAGRLKALNAYISFDPNRLREAARDADRQRAEGRARPLTGLALAIKDNIDVAGWPTTAGTPALQHWQPPGDAPVWHALAEVGAIVAGKANMHELAFGITSSNKAYGPVGNPWDRAMIPGGSSGGTAAAIAAGLAPAGLGSDTGGSCRIPAALCGCIGFRPTLGRYAQAGVVPLSATRDTVGPLGRSVADVQLLDRVIAPEKAKPSGIRLSGLKLGVPRRYFYDGLDRQLATVVERTLQRLREHQVELVEADIPDIGKLNQAVSFPVVLYEALRDLALYLAKGGNSLSIVELVTKMAGPVEKSILQGQLGKDAVPAAAYRQALVVARPRLQAAYARYFTEHGVAALVVPTTPLPARPIGEEETVELNGKRVPTFPTYIRNTDPPSNAGLPALSVPAGLTPKDLPVGLEFVGPAGSDARLLAIGRAFELARGPLPEPSL